MWPNFIAQSFLSREHNNNGRISELDIRRHTLVCVQLGLKFYSDTANFVCAVGVLQNLCNNLLVHTCILVFMYENRYNDKMRQHIFM